MTEFLQTVAKFTEVDRGSRTIRGAKLLEAGDLNDSRPWFVDETSIAQARGLMNRTNKGTKGRFSHDPGLGSYLGRWPSVGGTATELTGDFKFAESASSGPRGDLGGYVLGLAEEDPEALGVSLAVDLDRDAMRDAERDDGKQPLRFASIDYADFVGEPAATRGGLFEEEEEPAAEPETPETEESDMATATEKPVEEQQLATADDPTKYLNREDAAAFMAALGDERGSVAFLKGKSLPDALCELVAEQKAELAAKDEQLAELQQRLDAALAAAGEETPLEEGEPATDPDPATAARDKKREEFRKQGMSEQQAARAAFFGDALERAGVNFG